MANRSPRGDRPDLIDASHPGAKLPYTESLLYLGKMTDNFVHSRALLWILLNHVGNQCFHEFESMVLLIYTDQNGLNLRTNEGTYLDIAFPD